MKIRLCSKSSDECLVATLSTYYCHRFQSFLQDKPFIPVWIYVGEIKLKAYSHRPVRMQPDQIILFLIDRAGTKIAYYWIILVGN